MIIEKSRIRSLSRYFNSISNGDNVVIGIKDISRFPDKIAQLGFDSDLENGTTVLPSPYFGPISKYNAEGTYIVHKDMPKETAYREQQWTLEDWGGWEHSGFCYVPYQRYPRTEVPPPSVELTITTDQDNQKVIVTDSILYIEDNYKQILHITNLFLEIFGECNIMKPDFESFLIPEIKRVNWNILPPGEMPWERLEPELKPVMERQPQGNQPVIAKRFKSINEHNPNFVAVGQGGFDGYVVFGFPDQNMYILESVHTGNATYVFDDDWEALSQMTKAEILDNSLQKDRLIHRDGWNRQLDSLFF